MARRLHLPSLRRATTYAAVAALCAAAALSTEDVQAGPLVSVPCSGTGGGTPGLIQAIEDANAGDGGTIELAPNCTYTLTDASFGAGHGADGLPPIEKDVTITGRATSIVRADGAPVFRLFEVVDSSSASLSLSGLRLRNGDSGGGIGESIVGGGAILVSGEGTLTVDDCVLSRNLSANGGAISNHGATATVRDSRLVRNSASEDLGATGGAIINDEGQLLVLRSELSNNFSKAKGGAIQSPAGTTRVVDSTISGNVVKSHGTGGAIFNFDTLIVKRSTLAGNQALGFGANGGAIANYANGNLRVRDSTISGNVAGEKQAGDVVGGAIVNFGQGSVETTTIAGNRAVGPGAVGGGVANASGAEITLSASIDAGNARGNCAGGVGDGGFNLDDDSSCGFADHAVNADPRLVALADNGGPTETRALRPKSPAIDWIPASNELCDGTVDQRGVLRPQGTGCDIGSFERIP